MSASARRKNIQRRRIIRAAFTLVVLLALFWYAHENDLLGRELFEPQGQNHSAAFPQTDPTQLAVYFFDVGQGDSALVCIPDGDTPFHLLIDTGEYEYADGLTETLQALGVERIDALVCTHQHNDHMGCMARIVQRFEIGAVYMPKLPKELVPTTSAYEALLKAMKQKGLRANALDRGAQIDCPGGASIEALAPERDAAWEDLNNFSAVLRLSFGDTAFLFTGDAESASEKLMLQSGATLSADVLKCGHHGSRTSTSAKFLKAVSPDYAVISCGEDNAYGHPHEQVLEKLETLGVDIFRTDRDGSVLASSDGFVVNFTVGLPAVKAKEYQ